MPAAPAPVVDPAAIAVLPPEQVCKALGCEADGLSQAEAARRLGLFGLNRIARERRLSALAELWNQARTPLNGLLLGLALVSWLLARDIRSAVVIAAMVVLSVGLSFVQEHRSSRAAAALASMVRIHATVRRRDAPGCDADGWLETPLDEIAPGDVVRLSAGDMIPADLRLLAAKDLFVNQSALTGESLPQEKACDAVDPAHAGGELFALPNLCFMGSNVTSGFATGVVLRTGSATAFGQLAGDIVGHRNETSFDKGVAGFAGLMIRFIAVMAPLVFVINGLTKHDWLEALLFAVAVAVGLTPEMLPMIVTVNLARGAIVMSPKRVIVKRLNAIQNFGAMDVLCTDKTGTLTQDRIIMKLHLDVSGRDDDHVLMLAWLNSHFQSGLKNLLDQAVLSHAELERHLDTDTGYAKVDEVPFDFTRRRLSVVVRRAGEAPLLICKGAVEEVLAVCSHVRTPEGAAPILDAHAPQIRELTDRLNSDGFRVVAVATREMPGDQQRFTPQDEAELTLQGFIAFLDPPKETAAAAIAALNASGVAVKILTGDNDLVTRKVCRDVGLEITGLHLGHELEGMSDAELGAAVQSANVFAKVSPSQKARIIRALQATGHVVGFMGDGINDGPALKAADVGVSVDTAVDIAKESADIILLEKNLAVLNEGVLAGREVFGNIVKYIKMGASSNFGNMFSVLGPSMFLPFLPMLPIQVLTNNLLYDISQTAIPTDRVDREYMSRPRKWELGNITRFMVFVGPISSIFDYATFAVMLFVFHAWSNPALFQTGWFVESILTQTLIIHVIRTARLPFLESWASPALLVATVAVCAVAVTLPFTPLGAALGFVPLPLAYWPIIAGFLVSYAVLATLMKSWFIRRWGV
jgi:P-type Mg2+ transporter